MRKSKYTKELLQPIVKKNISLAGVLKDLGLKLTGSNYSHIKSRIEKAQLDISHFLGKASNCGNKHKGGPVKKTWEQVLVLKKEGHREKAVRLRRALVEYGKTYECEKCGLNEWLGEEIKLQIDHINGEWLDNRPENLRFMCPNCHSQTNNHSGSKGLTDLFTNKRMYQEYRKNKRMP